MADPVAILSPTELTSVVERLGAEITADYPGGVVLVGVLKGAVIFLSDLVRSIRAIDLAVDFIAISRFAPDHPRVRILKDVDIELEGRDVVIVEDLVDTGLTATYLRSQLESRGARSVELCALLDRPVRRIVPLDVRYRGVEIPDVFVLGYGLHLGELYRNLNGVYEVDRQVVQADPSAYLAPLYRGAGGSAIEEVPPSDGGVTSN